MQHVSGKAIPIPLNLILMEREPFARVVVGMVITLSRTKRGKKYIHIMMFQSSRYLKPLLLPPKRLEPWFLCW